ncbi:MAG TPA: hypothetical protein VGC91_15230 [Pyrinomonadaceae bacterium]|jgi:hypothetical protein
MKRKGLTIFFFSAMALAITPRAMQHFQNYMTAAQSRAQTELLNLLVSFGASAAETQPAPQSSQPAVCAAPAENKAQAATVKTREKVTSNALQEIAQNRSFEFAFPVAQPADFAKQAPTPSDHISTDFETRHVFEKVNSEAGALAPYLNSVSQKAESLKALVRAGKLDEKQAACELQKEFIALAGISRRTTPVVRLRFAREAIAAPAQPAAPASPKASDSQHASEDSMR